MDSEQANRRKRRAEWVIGVLLVPLIITVAVDQGYLRNPFVLPSLILTLAVICLHLFLTSAGVVAFGLRVKRGSGAEHPMLTMVMIVGLGAVLGGGLAWGWWVGLEESKEHLAALEPQPSQFSASSVPNPHSPEQALTDAAKIQILPADKLDALGEAQGRAEKAAREASPKSSGQGDHREPGFLAVTVADIDRAINNATPSQKESTKQRFVGVRVKWTGYLAKVEKEDNGQRWLLFDAERKPSFNHFAAIVEPFPGLDLLSSKTEMVIEGTIRTFMSSCPVLNPAKVVSHRSG